ncbi:MAG: dihydroxy-acid dehydratase [Promethearchaeota archaeon]
MRAAGLEPKEVNSKPLVGVANSWNELNPGHRHLRSLAEAVKYGIVEAGGIPMEFNTVAPCDGYANGNDGMRFILPQRDLVADSVEAMVEAHKLDALVTLSSCDKINPGMLMAAVRLDIPTVCVPGGPGMYEIHWVPGASAVNQDHYDQTDLKMKCISCASEGSCELMGTANTGQCLMEAFGMTLPGTATVPAFSSMKYILAKQSGRQVMTLLRKGITPSKIMTEKALENALCVDQAIGGSTNSAIHLPAIAHEMGLEFDLEAFNEHADKVPTIANISPTGAYGVTDLYKAGGVLAVMARIKEQLHLDCTTVSGKTWKRLLRRVKVLDDDVIRPLDNPVYPEGGTVVLKGNLAPRGAVIKQSAVGDPRLFKFEGEAVVFDSEREAIDSLAAGEIRNGHFVVIRYEGPRGAPGMPELLAFTASLMLLKELKDVAMLTDGRFSGATWGPCIGHVCPEAYVGGPIAVIEPGDRIKLDVGARRLYLDLPDDEIKERLEKWKPVERDVKSPMLRRYRKLVSSAARGAVLE